MIARLAILGIFIALATATPAEAQGNAAGVWRGKWTADATARRGEHGGALRVKLKPTGPCTYQGTFSGRFALVIPYFYRAEVVQYGDTLQSSKKLGPLGEYRMNLQHGGPNLNGTWNTTNHSGRIRLQRKR